MTMVSVRVPWMSTKARFGKLTEQYGVLARDYGEAQAQLRDLSRDHSRVVNDRNRLAKEMAQIRAALNEVSVYEGLVDVSPVAMMVSQLVHDHEELEARIDAVIHLISTRHGSDRCQDLEEVARLLRGGKRVPDTPEGLGG